MHKRDKYPGRWSLNIRKDVCLSGTPSRPPRLLVQEVPYL